MKIYDISMLVSHDMPVYKNKASKRPELITECDFSSSSVFESRLEINMHTGTHIDMTLHVIPDGKTTETLALEKVITVCKVLDLTDADGKISRVDLSNKKIKEGHFIILKTKNSYQDIWTDDFVFLDESGAEYLRSKKVSGVGIDSLGIERGQPEHDTHKILLGAGIVILEGLRLKEVEEGEYLLVALPIKLKGAEASPVRAVLLDEWPAP